MGFREILIIIGILVIVIIIWDASKHMRRRKIDKHHVNVSPLPTMEVNKLSDVKTHKAIPLVKLSSDVLDETKNHQQVTKSQSETIKADIPILIPDTLPVSVPKIKVVTATIGKKTYIDGAIKGHEDLLIEGVIKGNVIFKNSNITIGIHGQIIGDIYANSVHVMGVVQGNIIAAQRVALCKSAQMRGNLISPTLSIESGASFEGACIMESESKL